MHLSASKHDPRIAKAEAAGRAGIVFVVRGRAGANDRPAMPSGHPTSWGALTQGTVLDGAVYPHPVFDNFAGTR